MEFTDEKAKKYYFASKVYRRYALRKNSFEKKKYVGYANTLKKAAEILEKTGHIGIILKERANRLEKKAQSFEDLE